LDALKAVTTWKQALIIAFLIAVLAGAIVVVLWFR